jgi:hypothetical protein
LAKAIIIIIFFSINVLAGQNQSGFWLFKRIAKFPAAAHLAAGLMLSI